MSAVLRFYLRNGSPTDRATWERKQSDGAYVRVAETVIPGHGWLSTVWTGVDATKSPSPLIFESKMFNLETRLVLAEAQYANEAEAQAGHRAMVAKLAT